VFFVDLRTNSDYFPIQHLVTGVNNQDRVCLLRGTDWIFYICFKVNSFFKIQTRYDVIPVGEFSLISGKRH
jgi:hypothetical protein